ncbi:DUF2381 family protein [Archangium violaceum]|uniref:DUF2381 family protein n=1 Tax=Archangium violaceum Cb vi76 TaxID=1406225 RepID=A0A084SEQ3_9BACT|nr:DUF2381 family protein [Archangium violaceum]KFA86938.1 hypothetical protein Q664_51105 [Archangium violaceum Cb vi76]
MLIPLRITALLLLLYSSAPVLAQSLTPGWDISGAPRFTVTADTAGETREVPISPNRTLSFVFDTPVLKGGVVVEERARFRQVALSEDGLMLNLLPSDELKPGRRLRLTVRFADEASPTSLDFTLVVSPRAEPQVEVYREPRSCDSHRQQAEESDARARHYQTLLARERAERGWPRGIIGLLASKLMDEKGIRSKRITKDIVLRPGETFTVLDAVSYRATGGEKDAEVTRLAVELLLRNLGSAPWTPTHALLVGEGVRWEMEVWPPRPLSPGKAGQVLMEVEKPGRVGSGPFLLKLWQEGTTRVVTFSGVTFP